MSGLVVIIVAINVLFLVLYLLFKTPYKSEPNSIGQYLWLYKHDKDYQAGTTYSYTDANGVVKKELEFIGAWGKTKDEAQRDIDRDFKEWNFKTARPIVTRKCSGFEITYLIVPTINIGIIISGFLYIATNDVNNIIPIAGLTGIICFMLGFEKIVL